LLVSDQTPRLSAYAPTGQLIGRCRTFSTYAHGLTVQKDGSITIAEMNPDRKTLLVPVSNADWLGNTKLPQTLARPVWRRALETADHTKITLNTGLLFAAP
jgi:hypothetical protein